MEMTSLNDHLLWLLGTLFPVSRLLGLVTCLGLISWVCYARYIHPLSRVPGPYLPSITRLWYVYEVRKGRWDEVNRGLHARYGPVVRIAPDEVSISDPEAVHKVYSIKEKFTKTDFYPAWAPQGIDTPHGNIFTDMDEGHHAGRRRLVAHIYSMSGILESERFIDNSTKLLVDQLATFVQGAKVLDLGMWSQYYAFDVLDYGNWIKTLDQLLPVLATLAVLPASYRTPYLMTSATSTTMRKYLQNAGALVADAKNRVQERQETIEAATTERRDILQKLIQLHRTKGKQEDYQLGDIQMESYVNLLAGSDTTAIAMQAIFHQLLTHPDVLEKLLSELDNALHTGQITLPIEYADALKLSFFTACMKEAMRLHPSVGLQFPRHPPPEGCEIGGYYFPQSTRVGLNPAVLHYDRSVFGDDAEEFNPERWLGKGASTMDRYLLTFGGGTHTCLGKNISLAEIYKMIPHLLLLYKFELVDPKKPLTKHDWWFFKLEGLHVTVTRRERCD